MRLFGLIFMCLSLPLLASTQLTTQIHDIDYGHKSGDEILVFLKSGHVAKISEKNKNMLNNLTSAKANEEWFSFTLDKDRYIQKAKSVPAPFTARPKNFSSMNELATYVPTTIASMDVAQKYFRKARRTSKEETQCFNRAMVWSYEWWKDHSLKSNKLLIFFTRNYIRRYNFEWWFHIAPYVHVMEEGKVVERVMDVKYSRGPIPFRRWTDIFMRNDVECPVITKYSDYADYPYTGECYIYRTNMYTYQPADLQMNEAWGYTKDKFIMEEVKGAYQEAFDLYL